MEQITFCSRKDVIHVDKTNGTSVNYYIFPEYEVHTNCIAPHSVQEWHYHEKISETLLITKGKLLCRYLEGTDQHSRYLYEGIWSRWETVSIHLKMIQRKKFNL